MEIKGKILNVVQRIQTTTIKGYFAHTIKTVWYTYIYMHIHYSYHSLLRTTTTSPALAPLF